LAIDFYQQKVDSRSWAMIHRGQKIVREWRAAGAAIVLLLAWFCTPITLASQADDVCSMSCCIEQSHCCCSPHHLYVEGRAHNESQQIISFQGSAACPEGCATTSYSANSLFNHAVRGAIHHPAAAAVIPSQPRQVSLKVVESARSSPRAPPSPLIAR